MFHQHICLSILVAAAFSMLWPCSSMAQRSKKAAPKVEADTLPTLRGMELSVDVVGPVQRAVGGYGQYEAALRANLKDKYFPIIELGYGSANHEDDVTEIRYKTSAPYGRIGVDFNILKNKHDLYRVYVGGRYAFTSFKYDVQVADGITDPVWNGQAAYNVSDVSCNYHWIEALGGIQAHIWGPLSLGWSVRYKKRIAQKHGQAGEPWYVPGYGKRGASRLGATFNIIYSF